MSTIITKQSTLLGRALMTVATLMYGVIPPFVDLNHTHLFHPDWPAHARTHMMWLVVTNSSIAATALYFLWLRADDRLAALNIAGILGLCVLGGFFVSAATASCYGGALSDPGGVPPLGPVDQNLLGFSVAILLLIVGWFVARRKAT